jgi:hypothetical protein
MMMMSFICSFKDNKFKDSVQFHNMLVIHQRAFLGPLGANAARSSGNPFVGQFKSVVSGPKPMSFSNHAAKPHFKTPTAQLQSSFSTGPPGDRSALHCRWNAIATQSIGIISVQGRWILY